MANARAISRQSLEGLPSEGAALAVAETRKALLTHGMPPVKQSKRTAAAHEAGHVVINAFVGTPTKTACIFRVAAEDLSGYWAGYNESFKGRMEFDAATDHETAMVFALRAVGGYVGEEQAGLAHPSSSLDEIIYAQLVMQAVAESRGLAGDALWTPFYQLAQRIVAAYSDAHEAITDALEKNRKLRGDRLGHLCRGIKSQAGNLVALLDAERASR